MIADADTRSPIAAGRKSEPGLTVETAWEILDRFAQALQKSQQTPEQIRLILETVREGIRAEAVYWYSCQSGECPVVAGRVLSPDWCRGLTRRMLTETPGVDSQLLRSVEVPAPGGPGPPPQSVAMVRVSKSQGTWVVAVNFDPGRPFRPSDMKVMSLARRLLVIHRQNAQTYEKLKETLLGLVRCLAAAIDARHPYTWGHSERVARIAVRLGRQMDLPERELSDLYLAGLLHDVGKIGLRDDVLQKAGPLTDEEFAHVREHPVVGDRILSSITPLAHLRSGVRNHHERFDGGGYPDRLAGDAIPLLARIMAVADACDAMMSDRPYRPALPTERIDAIVSGGAGTQWDPRIIKHFLACRREIYGICERGLGASVRTAVEHALTEGDEVSSAGRGRPPVASTGVRGLRS
jgi:HD-GYP domain-containing protein (c-di-GMP phosphodiesterase class II)